MEAYVVYHSETGNTLKVALAVVSGLKQAGFGVVAAPVEEADPAEAAHFDVIALGTPVHGFDASKKMQEFAKNLPACVGNKAILFCTQGLHKGVALTTLEKTVSARGYEVAGKFSCAGRDAWGPLKLFGGIKNSRPNMKDLERAALFAKNLKLK